jgi:DHA1 family multidrug resistance protein-like MFS transporter
VGWKRSFYAILLAETLAVTGFNAVIPIIPGFIQSLGVTDPVGLKMWVGINATATAVSLSVFALIWGKLADVVGKRTMLLRAMIGGTVAMVLMGISATPWQFLVFRSMQGAITGTVAAATVLVATVSPKEEMGYALGLLQTGIYVGASAGPAIGGFLSDLLGYRANFFATAGFLFAASMIVIRFVEPDRPTRVIPGPIWKKTLPDFTPLALFPGLAILILISCALQVANSTVGPILPLFIQAISPKTEFVGSTTGVILGLSALAAALSAVGLGRVSRRIGYERTLGVCLIGAFIAVVPQAFVRFPWQLLVLRIIGGAMLGGCEPSLNALIALRTDKSRQGAVFGLSSSFNNIGFTVGPMIGAVLSAAFGFSFAFFAAAAILLVNAVLARTVRIKIAPEKTGGAAP